MPCKGILKACAMSFPVRIPLIWTSFNSPFVSCPKAICSSFASLMWIFCNLNQDLWRSRCCLQKIEGFDHSVVNETLGACGQLPSSQESPCLPYFIWQCGEIKVILLNLIRMICFNFYIDIHSDLLVLFESCRYTTWFFNILYNRSSVRLSRSCILISQNWFMHVMGRKR